MSDETILFLHIPKTAGTTLNRIIEQQYRRDEIYSADPTRAHPTAGMEELRSFDALHWARLRLLKGHLPFGVHELLPKPSVYFTVLREPVDRVLSYYYFLRRFSPHELHYLANTPGMDLQSFLENKISLETDNLQTRILSGAWLSVPYGQCTEELLAMAKKNLQERFRVVGLAEQFDETLLLLKNAFHWRRTFYVKLNVTRHRPRQEALTPQILGLIQKDNQLDSELYAYAQQLFAAHLQRQGADFLKKLRLFQARNRLFQPLLHVQWRLRKDSVQALLRGLPRLRV